MPSLKVMKTKNYLESYLLLVVVHLPLLWEMKSLTAYISTDMTPPWFIVFVLDSDKM